MQSSNLYAGYGQYFYFRQSPPYMAFLRILRIAAASPSRFPAYDRPPAFVTSCLSPREGATCSWLVDGERAPFPGVVFKLTIAIPNARVPTLSRPYPPHMHKLMRYSCEIPMVNMIMVTSVR
jgi:hypothetical protein